MSWIIERIVPGRLGRDFRWLVTSSWISNLGDGIALAAAPLLIASMTDQPILIASGAVMQFLPWLLFGLPAGAIADRVDRRTLVIGANIARTLVLLGLIAFLLTGSATIWIVLAAAFLYGTAEVVADTTSSTLLPMLVRPDDLSVGNVRLQGGYLVANQFVGPPLGAFLFAIGSFVPFVAQVVCILLAVMLFSRISHDAIRLERNTERTSLRGDIGEGVRWLWHHPPVRMLVLIILVFNVTWAAPWGVLVDYATRHLHMTAVEYGLLTAASAVGGVLATLSFGWLEKRLSFATLMRICLTLEVVMHLAFALTTNKIIAYVIMFGFGAYAFVWGAISTTVRQRLVPHELQGRIGAVNMVGVFGGMVIGMLLGGVIAQLWGPTAPWWFAFVGAALTLVLVWRPISHIVSAKPAAD